MVPLGTCPYIVDIGYGSTPAARAQCAARGVRQRVKPKEMEVSWSTRIFQPAMCHDFLSVDHRSEGLGYGEGSPQVRTIYVGRPAPQGHHRPPGRAGVALAHDLGPHAAAYVGLGSR